VLDRGGYTIYSGNPVEGITYFKQLAEHVDAGEGECSICGNTNPDDILHIVEARDVNEYGEFTSQRKTTPQQWYELYKDKIESGKDLKSIKSWIPYNKFVTPGSLRQFSIFFKRSLLSKLADRQFMSIALLIAPLLAVILGFFSKYVAGDEADPHRYIFSQNENLPAYLFMCVVVSLFLGLIIAAEEIIKDRKILERESFLNLNKSAYLISKISLLFILSAIQMLLFVVIGNLIMEIKGMTMTYWLVLFTTACSANLAGLIISDGLKSVVAIYVIVPFLLIPQILLAGVIVKFEKLHYTFTSHQVVPVAGDMMTSRWSYEALAVGQFNKNKYQKDYHEIDMLESNVIYDMQFLVPALIQEIQDVTEVFRSQPGSKEMKGGLKTIRDGFSSIVLTNGYPDLKDLFPDTFSESAGQKAIRWLEEYRTSLSSHRERLNYEKDALVDSLKRASGGADAYLQIKRENHNDQLADLVLNRTELRKIVKKDGHLLRKMDPIYMYPIRKNGRAHFYSSVKSIGIYQISTLIFNILLVWIISIFLYVLLRYSILRKILDFFSEQRYRQ